MIKQISRVQIVIVSESGINLWVLIRIWFLFHDLLNNRDS
jgi:hypothetical protein